MLIDFQKLTPCESYPWLINAINPRPIAWVSTISASGKTNLAPFSFFQGVCASPPTLLFTGANDRHGKLKDSVVNVGQVPEFVVNFVPCALREAMNQTSAPLPHGESEFEKFNIATAPSLRVRPPRVADAGAPRIRRARAWAARPHPSPASLHPSGPARLLSPARLSPASR